VTKSQFDVIVPVTKAAQVLVTVVTVVPARQTLRQFTGQRAFSLFSPATAVAINSIETFIKIHSNLLAAAQQLLHFLYFCHNEFRYFLHYMSGFFFFFVSS